MSLRGYDGHGSHSIVAIAALGFVRAGCLRQLLIQRVNGADRMIDLPTGVVGSISTIC